MAGSWMECNPSWTSGVSRLLMGLQLQYRTGISFFKTYILPYNLQIYSKLSEVIFICPRSVCYAIFFHTLVCNSLYILYSFFRTKMATCGKCTRPTAQTFTHDQLQNPVEGNRVYQDQSTVDLQGNMINTPPLPIFLATSY